MFVRQQMHSFLRPAHLWIKLAKAPEDRRLTAASDLRGTQSRGHNEEMKNLLVGICPPETIVLWPLPEDGEETELQKGPSGEGVRRSGSRSRFPRVRDVHRWHTGRGSHGQAGLRNATSHEVKIVHFIGNFAHLQKSTTVHRNSPKLISPRSPLL